MVAKKGDQPTRSRGTRKTAETRLSDIENSLLRKLAGKPRSRSTVGVVLSPEEMEVLRQLSGIDPESRPRRQRPRRTADLQIAEGEREVLRQIARAEQGGPPDGGAPPARKRTTEIELTAAEIGFLQKLSGQKIPGQAAEPEPGSRLRETLLEGAPGSREGGVVLEVTGPEAHWLEDLTRQGAAVITEVEREARSQLLEKIDRALAPPADDEAQGS